MDWGEYPKEYNRHIHGPFDPSRYYGKPDTPFPDVQIKDLPAWLSRRSMNPRNWLQAWSRFMFRWQNKWLTPKRVGPAGLYQFIFFACTISYFGAVNKMWKERNYKYH